MDKLIRIYRLLAQISADDLDFITSLMVDVLELEEPQNSL